jgi:hypothetical protein
VTSAAMATELTFIMIKPDGVQRGLIGDIISRFEKKGFFLKGEQKTEAPAMFALSLSLSLSLYIYIYIYDSNFELGSIW